MAASRAPLRLHWEGHLDAADLPRLLGEFSKVQDQPLVELHLDRCLSLESAVFSLLTQLVRTVWSSNGKITLHHPTPAVLRLLKDSRLDQAVTVILAPEPRSQTEER